MPLHRLMLRNIPGLDVSALDDVAFSLAEREEVFELRYA